MKFHDFLWFFMIFFRFLIKNGFFIQFLVRDIHYLLHFLARTQNLVQNLFFSRILKKINFFLFFSTFSPFFPEIWTSKCEVNQQLEIPRSKFCGKNWDFLSFFVIFHQNFVKIFDVSEKIFVNSFQRIYLAPRKIALFGFEPSEISLEPSENFPNFVKNELASAKNARLAKRKRKIFLRIHKKVTFLGSIFYRFPPGRVVIFQPHFGRNYFADFIGV